MSIKPQESPRRKGAVGRHPGIADVISALHRWDGHLAPREQLVADYVSAHLDEIGEMTIADLAMRAGVSTPTVVRFCRTLGVDGYREFKLRLVQNLAVGRQYLEPDYGHAYAKGATPLDEVVDALTDLADRTRKQIDPSTFERACELLCRTGQIVFAGIGGGSTMVAGEAANRFFRLGIPTVAISDSYVLQMRAATLTERDILFLVSASGEADAIVAAAEVARTYGAGIVALTEPETRLAAAATVVLPVHLPEGRDIFRPTASRYVHLMIIDALAIAVARNRRDDVTENLRRIRASLTAYHGRIGPQPLGD